MFFSAYHASFTKINSFSYQRINSNCYYLISIRIAINNTHRYYQLIETKHRQLSEVSQRRIASRLLIKNSVKQQITRSAPGKLKWRPMGLRQVCNAWRV
ncbi:hypothetical protein D4M95_24685 [Enterobacter roggenkampii]|nr:hypothetical protein D4M93_24770 [Enterobacter roggenkampii]TXU83740.1 hypothetical protein D4M95_24685 [Enterobacter roggenkampii]TYF63415.1 hypothetical protein DJ544_24625 [Enterobacter roggenkampii]